MVTRLKTLSQQFCIILLAGDIERDMEPGVAVAWRAGGGWRGAAGGQRVQRLHLRGAAARVSRCVRAV